MKTWKQLIYESSFGPERTKLMRKIRKILGWGRSPGERGMTTMYFVPGDLKQTIKELQKILGAPTKGNGWDEKRVLRRWEYNAGSKEGVIVIAMNADTTGDGNSWVSVSYM